ncbi:MAG: hypothetical protein ACK4PR_13910, partial [Gammaproteobacteria bacterium]
VPTDRQHPTTQVITLPNGNVAVVAFYQVNYGGLNTVSPQQVAMYNKQIAIDYGRVDYALYMRSLKKSAQIKINPSIGSVDN